MSFARRQNEADSRGHPGGGERRLASATADTSPAGRQPSGEPADAASPKSRVQASTAPNARAGFIPRITIGAFAQDPAVKRALAEAASDRRMLRAAIEITDGGIDSATDLYRETPAPDLIIVESGLAREDLFPALEDLAEQCPPGTRVIVIGRDNDVTLYRQLLKAGVGEYLVPPLTPMTIIDAIAQLFQEEGAESLGRVVAFLGARGGAGSSTVAQNVAVAMAGLRASSVLLIDLDLRFGTVALDLNMEPPQGVGDALAESDRLDETLLDRLVASRSERIGVLAAPCQLDAAEPDPEAIGRLIEAARAVAPSVLLDLPHSWAASNRRALLAADEIVLTTTPDLAALRNARNISGALRAERANDPPPRLVLNKVGVPKRREISPGDLQRVLELEPAAVIPYDPVAFSAAAASGNPVAETRKSAAAAEAFQSLAWSFTRQKPSQPARGGLYGLARRLVRAR